MERQVAVRAKNATTRLAFAASLSALATKTGADISKFHGSCTNSSSSAESLGQIRPRLIRGVAFDQELDAGVLVAALHARPPWNIGSRFVL